MSTTTMEIIVSEGRDRDAYPGASKVIVYGTLPEYRGGVTMIIQVPPQVEPVPPSATLTIDANVRGGVPCVGAKHWPIAHILQRLASGLSPDQLAREDPDLRLADIQLALDVAAWVMRDPSIDWLALDLPGMVDFQREMEAWQSLSHAGLRHSEHPLED